MNALEKMREAFDKCTVMAGVESDFECVYITKDAVNALLEEVEAENAELREDIRDLEACCQILSNRAEGYFSWAVQADVQNDKLRELVKDMWNCSDPCNDCPHYNSSNDEYYCDLGAGWKARRMRELGFEVE